MAMCQDCLSLVSNVEQYAICMECQAHTCDACYTFCDDCYGFLCGGCTESHACFKDEEYSDDDDDDDDDEVNEEEDQWSLDSYTSSETESYGNAVSSDTDEAEEDDGPER